MRAVLVLQGLCLLLAVAPCASCGRVGFELKELQAGGDAGAPKAQLTSDSGVASGGREREAGTESAPESDAAISGAQEAGPNVQDAGGLPSMPDPLAGNVIHHYAFNGTGTSAADTAGSAHGTLVGATLDGMGSVALSGGIAGPHVELPAGLISSLDSVSVEAWLTWNGGGGYQHVFDFGNSSGGAGAQGRGTRFFALAIVGSDSLRLVFDADAATDSSKWRSVFSSPGITALEIHQLVAVFDRAQNEIRLYVDGGLRGSAAVPVDETLSDIDDVNKLARHGSVGC